jgi:hypothetical protein
LAAGGLLDFARGLRPGAAGGGGGGNGHGGWGLGLG